MKNLLGFMWNFFGRFWEGDLNDFKKINLNILIKYSKILENNPAIIELSRILGRTLGQSDILKTRIVEKKVIEYVSLPVGTWAEEIIGITIGKQLEHLLPFELINLAKPELNVMFYKRLIDGKLTISEFQSNDLVPREVIVKQEVKTYLPESEGPIIMCIDTSKSMKGAAEVVAKSIVLAITKMALEQNRSCYMINFSGIFEVYDLSSLKASLTNLIHFLGHSFVGQTNINPVFNHILTIMKTKKYENADLLLISDFMCSNLLPEQILAMKKLQDDHNRFFALELGTNYFNNNWKTNFNSYFYYDPRDPFAVKKILFELSKNQKNY